MKTCFTINQFRSNDEIKSYCLLFEKELANAIEIFYPIDRDKEGFNNYTNSINSLLKYNIDVVMHLPHGKKYDLCNLDKFEETFKIMIDAIDYSKNFLVNKFTLHLGYVNGDRSVVLNHVINYLIRLCDYAYPRYIMIENMPSSAEMGYSPEEILYIIKKVNKDNIKFIMDTGHANVSEYEMDDYLNVLKDHLFHLHINDNNGLRDEHKRIGEGNIDFKNFFSKLSSYQELYCLEILYNSYQDLITYCNDLKNIIN